MKAKKEYKTPTILVYAMEAIKLLAVSGIHEGIHDDGYEIDYGGVDEEGYFEAD